MYSEWASLSPVIAANSNGSSSTVLNKFSSVAGREVSQSVVKQLASNLGITQSPEPSILVTDDEVSQIVLIFFASLEIEINKDNIKFLFICFRLYTGELVHECYLSWFVYTYSLHLLVCVGVDFILSSLTQSD